MSGVRDELSRLIFSYAERLDLGDFGAVAALFEQASYGPAEGPMSRGAAAVEKILREFVILYEDGTPRTKHLTSNLIVEVDADGLGASARSYFAVLQAVDGSPLQPIISGRYHDRFARGSSRWHFSERRIFMDLVGDLSRHLHSVPASA